MSGPVFVVVESHLGNAVIDSVWSTEALARERIATMVATGCGVFGGRDRLITVEPYELDAAPDDSQTIGEAMKERPAR